MCEQFPGTKPAHNSSQENFILFQGFQASLSVIFLCMLSYLASLARLLGLTMKDLDHNRAVHKHMQEQWAAYCMRYFGSWISVLVLLTASLLACFLHPCKAVLLCLVTFSLLGLFVVVVLRISRFCVFSTA